MSRCIWFAVFLSAWTATQTFQLLGAAACRAVGTSNKSASDAINITSFYDKNSRSIKINITTDDLHHKCINVIHRESNESSSKDCDSEYDYSYFTENVLERSTVYPGSHSRIQEFLQPGCTYEVYVWDQNGNYTQQQFTLPECFMQLCNCRNLHPELEISNIKQSGANELLVKWQELRVENTRITKKLVWWIRKENGPKFNCEEVESNSGSTLLKCNENMTAENYTLNAGFIDGFGCKGKEIMQFSGIDMNPTEEVMYLSVSHQLVFVSLHVITNNLSLLKQSDGRVIEVVAVYNADYKILQLNISWNDLTESNYYVVKVKSHHEDASDRCYINSHVNASAVSKKITNYHLPQADENYTLLPGCSYQVSVLTPTLENTIQYTVPVCLESYVAEIETPPVLTNNFTFLEIAYQDHFDLLVEAATVLSSDLSYVCECALLTSKANGAVFNCSYALQRDYSYIISLSLNDAKKQCIVKYLQTLDPTPTNRLSRSANNEDILASDKEETVAALHFLNAPAEIVGVEAFYNQVDGVIQLNVTLTSQANRTNNELHVHVMALPNNKTHTCDNSYIYERILNINTNATSVTLPVQPSSKSEEIQSACTYEIQIDDSISYDYTVPVCVGPICNYCSNSTPQVELKSITQVSTHTLNITWLLKTPVYYNISQVEFKYRENETSHIPHRCKLLSSTHDLNITDEIYSSVDCRGLVEGTKYVLIGTITNHFNCTRVVSKSFVAVRFENSEEIYKHHMWLEIPPFLAILLLASLILYCKRKVLLEKFKLSNTRIENYEIYEMPAVGETKKSQECYNIIYCESEILSGNVDKYEIPRTRVKIVKLLDSGAFGQVFSAKIMGTVDNKPLPPVAVKTLRDHAPPEELEDFLSEIEILKRIGEHPNIVKLIGCCTLKQPYMMIMELVPCGSLKSYLLKLRKRWENYKTNDSVFLDSADGDYIQPDTPSSQASTIPSHRFPSLTETEYTNVESEGHTPLLNNFNYSVEPALDHTELQNFALQIAKGMAYLEEKQITHRDLAARNVLINEFKTLKISDFGLSRIGPYINSKTKKLPLRWMSIEAIEEHFYNNKSDVWSFAIVLWEIGSLGAIPYENTPDALILHDLLLGKRLEKPAICTDELYKLMLNCWSHNPNLRPSFAELVEQLDTKKTKIYVDFSQLNPTYVFPPSALEKMSNTQIVTKR